MCGGKISRNQRLPRNPSNGQMPAWNALTQQWEASDPSGLPGGGNNGDTLFFDADNNTWYVGPAPVGFNPASDYGIDGQFTFNNGLDLKAVDPVGSLNSTSGIVVGSDINENLFVKNSTGVVNVFRTSQNTAGRVYTFPDVNTNLAGWDVENIFSRPQTFVNNIHVGATNGNGFISYAWQNTTPVGNNNTTSMWFDAIGRMNWRPGTGVNSFVRTFDATGITAGRTYTLPDANTALAGLNLSQTFTATQSFGSIFLSGNAFFGNNNSVINSLGQAGFGVNGGLSARLTVRGDGTNPVFRAENSTGAIFLQMLNNGNLTLSEGALAVSNGNITSGGRIISTGGYANTGGVVISNFEGNTTFAAAAGSANFRPFSITYTINNTGAQTGAATGIFVNGIQSSLNGMSHRLIDLQSDGISRFFVDSTGNGSFTNWLAGSNVFVATTGFFGFGGLSATGSRIYSASNGTLRFSNSTNNGFNLLQFGGTTNVFPAIKTNGNTLEFRLADDSAFTRIAAEGLSMPSNGKVFQGSLIVREYYDGATASNYSVVAHPSAGSQFFGFGQSTSTLNASPFYNMLHHRQGLVIQDTLQAPNNISATVLATAALQVNSTTRGILLPRLTTAERDLIVAPATGLEIYNRTTNTKQYFNGSVWKTLLTD